MTKNPIYGFKQAGSAVKKTVSTMVKTVVTGTIAFSILIPTHAAPTSTEDVHQMAEVCMLAERLLKDYAMIGMGVTYHDPAEDLKQGEEKIITYLKNIESHGLKAELDAEVRSLEEWWHKIEKRLLAEPTKEGMVEFREEVDNFSLECEKVADHLAIDTGIEAEHDVVLISQLGMETQRLAALYMMKAWGVEDPKYYEHVEEIFVEFEDIYHELMAESDEKVPAVVKEKLEFIDKQFIVFKVMAATKSDRLVPTRAEKTASKIFDKVQEALKLEQSLVE